MNKDIKFPGRGKKREECLIYDLSLNNLKHPQLKENPDYAMRKIRKKENCTLIIAIAHLEMS